MKKEDSLLRSTNNETLKGVINKSYSGLENLYDKFNNFSETNN